MYSIHISGKGTREEIAQALREVIIVLVGTLSEHTIVKDLEDIDNAEWEEGTLLTEINAI